MTFIINTPSHAVLAFGLLLAVGAPAFAQGEAPRSGGALTTPPGDRSGMNSPHTSGQGEMAAPAGTSSGMSESDPSTHPQGSSDSSPPGGGGSSGGMGKKPPTGNDKK
jgi:hypothetical protein